MPAQQQRTGSNPVKVGDNHLPIERLRLQRMARTLRLTDQLLSTDIDALSLVEGKGSAPAWTSADGSNITIDVSRMPSLTQRRGVAVWLGTNAHELFHNLYTPRTGSLLMRRVGAAERSTDPGIHRSWNVLEDQRIERLGLARYSAWRGYLIAALSHHIYVAHPEAWLLVAGRTWLSDEARAIARATFVATNGEHEAHRVAELIGAYQRLADPGEDDATEAWAIVDEFHGSFGSSIPPKGSCGGAGGIEEGEPEQVDDDEVQYPTADEADDDDDESGDDEPDDEGEQEGGGDDESDDDAADDGDDGDESGDEDGDESDGDDGDSDGDDDSADDDDESDSDADGDGGNDDEGDAAAEDDFDPGDGTSEPGETRSITEAIDEELDEALDEDETSADLDRVIDNLAHGVSGGGNLPRTSGEWIEATEEAKSLARGVSAVLADIRDDCEAAWIRRTDTGRFSVDRWATDPDWDADNVFDQFDPGAMDASSLDLVLVLDVSGSMSQQNMRLAEATWAIRHAVDRVEGEVTCIAFGNDASLMFSGNQRPDGRIFIPHLEDSTDPTAALREAHRIVAESKAMNRIVMVLTDGQWWNTSHAEQAIRAAGSEGAITCVVGLGKGTAKQIQPGFAGAEHTAIIVDSSELVPIFRTLAEQSMRAAAGR